MTLDEALAEIEKAETELPREMAESPLSSEDHRMMLQSWLSELKGSMPESDWPTLETRFYGMLRRVDLVYSDPGFDGGDGEPVEPPTKLGDVA